MHKHLIIAFYNHCDTHRGVGIAYLGYNTYNDKNDALGMTQGGKGESLVSILFEG